MNALDDLRQAAEEAQGADFDAGRKDAHARFDRRKRSLGALAALLNASKTMLADFAMSEDDDSPECGCGVCVLARAVRQVEHPS